MARIWTVTLRAGGLGRDEYLHINTDDLSQWKTEQSVTLGDEEAAIQWALEELTKRFPNHIEGEVEVVRASLGIDWFAGDADVGYR
ncbi:MAG: hypothetical protein K1X67_07470 [Fimbriimonadaceae bacterium]|nr:hypothetical protein [Fimbriimonadaceae bacterium]